MNAHVKDPMIGAPPRETEPEVAYGALSDLEARLRTIADLATALGFVAEDNGGPHLGRMLSLVNVIEDEAARAEVIRNKAEKGLHALVYPNAQPVAASGRDC